ARRLPDCCICKYYAWLSLRGFPSPRLEAGGKRLEQGSLAALAVSRPMIGLERPPRRKPCEGVPVNVAAAGQRDGIARQASRDVELRRPHLQAEAGQRPSHRPRRQDELVMQVGARLR